MVGIFIFTGIFVLLALIFIINKIDIYKIILASLNIFIAYMFFFEFAPNIVTYIAGIVLTLMFIIVLWYLNSNHGKMLVYDKGE